VLGICTNTGHAASFLCNQPKSSQSWGFLWPPPRRSAGKGIPIHKHLPPAAAELQRVRQGALAPLHPRGAASQLGSPLGWRGLVPPGSARLHTNGPSVNSAASCQLKHHVQTARLCTLALSWVVVCACMEWVQGDLSPNSLIEVTVYWPL
jgi:hypothetical protein